MNANTAMLLFGAVIGLILGTVAGCILFARGGAFHAFDHILGVAGLFFGQALGLAIVALIFAFCAGKLSQ